MLGLKLWMLPLGGAVLAAALVAIFLMTGASAPSEPTATSSESDAPSAVTASESMTQASPSLAAEPAIPSIETPTEGYPAPDFRGIDAWLNSQPRTMEELRGQVVLIDFWTYS